MTKRFTYRTEDGKRHWTPVMGVPWPYDPPHPNNLCQPKLDAGATATYKAGQPSDQAMTDQPKTLSVPHAGKLYFDLGRNASYDAVRRGEIPVIKIGGRLRVPVIALERMLEASEPASVQLPAASAAYPARQRTPSAS